MELLLIRWIPANVRYIGYFSNFILLACFLGIGIGILLSRRSWRLLPFPVMLLVLVVAVALNRIEVRLESTQVLYYGAGEGIAKSEHYLVLPFVILLVVFFGRNILLIFIALGAVQWLDMARIVRGQTLSLKRKEFIEAAHASGVSAFNIVRRHIIHERPQERLLVAGAEQERRDGGRIDLGREPAR